MKGEEEKKRREEEESKKKEDEVRKRKEREQMKRKEEEERKKKEEEEKRRIEKEERKKKEEEEKRRMEKEERKKKEEEEKKRKEEEERKRKEEEERNSGQGTGKDRKSEGHREESDQVNDPEVDLVDAGRSRLLMSVKDIPLPVYSQVCLSLNVRRHVRSDDFRMLGDMVGLSSVEIEFVGQRENPADEILKTWSSRSEATVAKLIELLKHKDFGRIDVAQIVEDWVYSKKR
ncbi:Stress response protein nst1 [Stylophora pistillata]|uniref:Stress response protein nst1 n=1 Tax=Stylophora pistillata TaxID=50429 RepID=A0A2B4S3E7_STYPI|nr:Stress response protein nst1 [Stylophora pistillata]